MTKKEIAPIIIGKLLNIGGMLQKNGNYMLQPFDLNQQQFSILFSIYESGKVNQKSMVNKLVLEKAHVSKVVKKLHGMELIDIKPSDDDKRSSWLIITEKGKKTVKACQKIMYKWNEDWTKDIELSKLQTALESLQVLQSLFNENT